MLKALLGTPQVTVITSVEKSPFSIYVNVVHVEATTLPILTQEQFKLGDKVYYIPVGYEVSEDLLKTTGCWDSLNNCGALGGPNKDVICVGTVKGFLSYGMIIKYDETKPIDLDKHCKLYISYNDVLDHPSMPLPKTFNIQPLVPIRKDVGSREEYAVFEAAPGISVFFMDMSTGFNPVCFGKAKNTYITTVYLADNNLCYKNIRTYDSVLFQLYTDYHIDDIITTLRQTESPVCLYIHATVMFPKLYSTISCKPSLVINKITTNNKPLKLSKELAVCSKFNVPHIPLFVENSIVTESSISAFLKGESFTGIHSIAFKGIPKCGLYLRKLDKNGQDVIIDSPRFINLIKGEVQL